MSATLYTTEILRLASSLPYAGRLEAPDATSEKRSKTCGSWVAIDVKMDAERRIVALGQDVKACALGQASAALLVAYAVGRDATELERASRSLADYLNGTREDPGDCPGLTVFSPARSYVARHASICLAFEAASDAAKIANRSA